MTTLRVRLAAPFDPEAPARWWRAGDDGRVLDRGTAVPGQWPRADRVEVAVGPADVRLVALALPPMSDVRRAGAAAFALDDQLAAPAGSSHLHLRAPTRPGGATIARVVDRATIAWLCARRPAIDRVVAEPDLAPSDGAWHWCVDDSGRGFVRRPDGSAFATEGGADGSLPPELAAALAQARRDADAPPSRVVVDADVPADALSAWSRAAGVTFAHGTAWSLERVPARAWSAAPDLREGFATSTPAPGSIARRFVPAAVLVGAALALHVAATVGGWLHDRYVAWRADRAVVELARGAGFALASDAAAADAALAKRAASALHASGRMAEGDFVPLLARAAPALAALPPGTLRRITYGDDRLVAELGPIDEQRLSALVRDLAGAGLAPVAAPVGGGARIAMAAAS